MHDVCVCEPTRAPMHTHALYRWRPENTLQESVLAYCILGIELRLAWLQAPLPAKPSHQPVLVLEAGSCPVAQACPKLCELPDLVCVVLSLQACATPGLLIFLSVYL